MEPGIYLELTPARSSNPFGGKDFETGDFKHAYLVYRKPDGTSEVIRGGLNPMGLKVSVETRKSLEKSKDALEAGEKPGDRPSRKLDIPAEKLEDTWSKMRDKAEEIGKAEIEYRADTEPDDLDQTSNSVVRAALDEVGVPLEKALPDGITPDKLPGIKDNLADDLEKARRNPIEGEIGGTDDQNPTPSEPVDPSDSGGEDNGPSGLDDGADDDDDLSGKGGSGDAENQSASLDAVPAPETKELKPGQKALVQTLEIPDGRIDDILVKDPRDLTHDEFMDLKKEMLNLPAGPEQERLDEMATNFLEEKFGTGPAKVDAVGRLIDPEPIRPINKHPVPARTPDGEPLSGAIRKIGFKVARAAGDEGNAQAVQNLQSGLNLLRQVLGQEAAKPPARTLGIVSEIKTDGIVGPKTRRALRFATSRLGRPKIEEGFALGRFNNFAREGRKEGFGSLGEVTEKAFGPLFRGPGRQPKPPAGRLEAVTLQETLNDLGKTQFGNDRFKPLKLDGDIGPKTTDAFGQLTGALGPERLTERFGEFLGFF